MKILYQFTYGDENGHHNGDRRHDYVIAESTEGAMALLGSVPRGKLSIQPLCEVSNILQGIPKS